MAAKLERLAYYSKANIKLDSLLVISDILAVSQRNNRRDQITGSLVYCDATFFQVVEGPREDLDRLIRRLEGDSRHGEITVVSRSEVSSRIFPDWSMTTPRLSPDLAAKMMATVTAAHASPTAAIELLRQLSVEDAIHPADWEKTPEVAPHPA